MTSKEKIVMHQDPIGLGGLDWQWEQGDKFALVEAIAICSANNWDYPKWVKKIVGDAMVNLYKAVYPEVDLFVGDNGKAQRTEVGGNELRLAENLKKARSRALEEFGLQMNRANAIQRRKETLRNIHLAHLVAEKSTFIRKPKPRFKGYKQVVPALADALELKKEGPPSQYPRECWGASIDNIRRAWERYRDQMIILYVDLPDSEPE